MGNHWPTITMEFYTISQLRPLILEFTNTQKVYPPCKESNNSTYFNIKLFSCYTVYCVPVYGKMSSLASLKTKANCKRLFSVLLVFPLNVPFPFYSFLNKLSQQFFLSVGEKGGESGWCSYSEII